MAVTVHGDRAAAVAVDLADAKGPFEAVPFLSLETLDAVMHGRPPRVARAVPVEVPLLCTLEELYHGCKKKIELSTERTVVEVGTARMHLVETVVITVEPGWKEGKKIVFREKGNRYTPAVIPADVVFVIRQKTHPVFVRDGDDLIREQVVSMGEALSGDYSLQLLALDGQQVVRRLGRCIRDGDEEAVPMLGMPTRKDRLHRGKLRVKFRCPELAELQNSSPSSSSSSSNKDEGSSNEAFQRLLSYFVACLVLLGLGYAVKAVWLTVR